MTTEDEWAPAALAADRPSGSVSQGLRPAAPADPATGGPVPRGARRRARRRRRQRRLIRTALGVAVLVGAVAGALLWSHGPGPRDATVRARQVDTPVAHRAPPFRVPQPDARSPLRLLEVGDSLGIDLGEQLVAQLAGAPVSVSMQSQGDTGLANSLYFDWPAQLGRMLSAIRPRIVVVFLGANDDQGITGTGAAPGTAAWDADYSQRVATMADEARAAGAATVWVGMPPMGSPVLSAWMQHLDGLVQKVLSGRPDALFVPAVPALGPATWVFEPDGPGPSGAPADLRTPDGVHLTPDGAGVLAHAVVTAIEQRWHLSLSPAPPTPSPRTPVAPTSGAVPPRSGAAPGPPASTTS